MKNHQIIFVALLIAFLSSCSTSVTYLGDEFPLTTSVDIYYSAHDVQKAYKVIGHLTCPYASQAIVKKSFSAYAKKIGADAVVITGTESSEDHQASVVHADALKYNQ